MTRSLASRSGPGWMPPTECSTRIPARRLTNFSQSWPSLSHSPPSPQPLGCRRCPFLPQNACRSRRLFIFLCCRICFRKRLLFTCKEAGQRGSGQVKSGLTRRGVRGDSKIQFSLVVSQLHIRPAYCSIQGLLTHGLANLR